MAELSKFQAFVHAKCPRCRKGDIFIGNAYAFRLQRTNEYCPYCNLRFEREPGFFYVSMFISYAMSVAEIISIGVATDILGLRLSYENLWYYLTAIFSGIILLSPFNYRYSRVLLLYYLTPGLHYDANSRHVN